MYQDSRRLANRNAFRNQQIPSKKALLKMRRKEAAIIVAVVLVAVVLFIFFEQHHKSGTAKDVASTASHSSSSAPQQTSAPSPGQQSTTTPSGFNKNLYATTTASSLWVVVNKKHQLSPKDYTPANLVVPNIPLRPTITSTEKYVRADTAKALEQLVQAAAGQGIHFNLQSGYRSYSFQTNLYNGYVKQQGQAAADRQSARPGYSEHQTGLAADLGGTSNPGCNVEQCYATTVEGKWLAANAYTYGFIIRYTQDTESVTGYEYEPWHIRYVGTELAGELHRTGIVTLEEFFGIGGGTSY